LQEARNIRKKLIYHYKSFIHIFNAAVGDKMCFLLLFVLVAPMFMHNSSGLASASSGESSADNTQIRLKDGTLKLLPLIPVYYQCKHERFLTTSVVILCYEPRQSADHSRDSHL
jgi:hypothetical protein